MAQQFTLSTAAQRHVKVGELAGWGQASKGESFKDRDWGQILSCG